LDFRFAATVFRIDGDRKVASIPVTPKTTAGLTSVSGFVENGDLVAVVRGARRTSISSWSIRQLVPTIVLFVTLIYAAIQTYGNHFLDDIERARQLSKLRSA
jgi:hypothetical protein